MIFKGSFSYFHSYTEILGSLAKKYTIRDSHGLLTRCFIKESLNNIYITIIDARGSTLISCSGGLQGNHRMRTSAQVVEKLIIQIMEFYKNHPDLLLVVVVGSVYNANMKLFVRGLVQGLPSRIRGIINKVAVPHNGVRGRKLRRK